MTAHCSAIRAAEAETDGITGTWDSIHIAEVTERSPTAAFYKLTTTIILQCETTAEGVKNDVGGYRMQVVSWHAACQQDCWLFSMGMCSCSWRRRWQTMHRQRTS